MGEFLVHYGWPEKILTDQGKSFENNLIQELCELAQVKKLHTSPYHPKPMDNVNISMPLWSTCWGICLFMPRRTGQSGLQH